MSDSATEIRAELIRAELSERALVSSRAVPGVVLE